MYTRFFRVTLLLVIALLAAVPAPAHAQTITVTDPNCTRDGLNTAIQNAPDGSTITFSCGGNAVIEFASEINIEKTLTIIGNNTIILDGIEGD
ncbi:MAG: hypothetical protein AAF653_05580, partial [Chloroflexota bacterium]